MGAIIFSNFNLSFFRATNTGKTIGFVLENYVYGSARKEILSPMTNFHFGMLSVHLRVLKGAVSRNPAKLGNYKMPVKLRET